MRKVHHSIRVVGAIALCVVSAGVRDRMVLAQTPVATSACVLGTAKSALPDRLRLGQRTTVTLTTSSDCPSRTAPVNVVLAIDASSSMESDGKIAAARLAAKSFVSPLDLTRTRVGVTSFNSAARVATELTDRRDVIDAAIDGITMGRGTDIAAGIDLSRAVLGRGRGLSPRPIEAMIVMSDGQQWTGGASGPAQVIAAAERAKAEGILVATICFGGDCADDVMRQAASRADLYFNAQSGDSLVVIYERLAGQLVQTSLRELTIVDTLPANMRYIAGSALPAPVETGADWLKWTWTVVPASGVTASFDVEPLEPGHWPTNKTARAEFRDTDDLAGAATFPVPYVDVIAPTATPTATPTPTPTATPTATPSPSVTPTATPTPTSTPTPTPAPLSAYLPLGLRERCVPALRRVDAVLVLDASSSMAERTASGVTKLEAAKTAVRRFATGLHLDSGDQVALVTFNDGARVLQALTGDGVAFDRALGAVRLSEFTRLDLGVRAGRLELMSVRHRRSSKPVLVVITDGIANPVPVDAAIAEAEVARSLDHVVFTIGIGRELDRAALREMASEARYAYETADGDDLGGILAAIAETIPCPSSAFWGRR